MAEKTHHTGCSAMPQLSLGRLPKASGTPPWAGGVSPAELSAFPMAAPPILGTFRCWYQVLNSPNAQEVFEAVNSVEWHLGPFIGRRLQVLVQLWNGNTTRQISDNLYLSATTVRNELERALRAIPLAHEALRQEFIRHGIPVDNFPGFELLEQGFTMWRSLSHATSLRFDDPQLRMLAATTGYPSKCTLMGGGAYSAQLVYLLCTQQQLKEAAVTINATVGAEPPLV